MLDPPYPRLRRGEILRLAGPRAWIALAAAGAPPPEVEELLADWETEGRLIRRVLLPGGGPAAAGAPKGILGRQGPLSHFLPWQRERFGLTAGDRYSLLSGLAHDPLQRDLFT